MQPDGKESDVKIWIERTNPESRSTAHWRE
jgi:hypothetical protein